MESEGEIVMTMRPPPSIAMKVRSSEAGEAVEQKMAADEPVSPGGRLFHEPDFDCQILSLIGMGKKIDVDATKAGLEATIVHHPRFSSIPVWDDAGGKSPRWVPTRVVVDDHLVVPDLSAAASLSSGAPPSPAASDKLVEDYASSLSSIPLDPSRPLWEFHLLNIRTSEAEAVAVFRAHHSLGDGVSLISLLLSCTRKSSDPKSLPNLPSARRPAAAAASPFRRLRNTLAVAWHSLVDVLLFLATLLFLRDTDTPIRAAAAADTRFHPKRLVHRTVSLDDVKTIKNSMKCTVNDVLIGVTSAGLSRYLTRKCRSLPDQIRLRTALIVNLRPLPGINDLARMMEGDRGGARWGNSIGYVLFPLSVRSYKDPLDYVREGKAAAERKKSSIEAFFTHHSMVAILKMFGSKMAAAVCRVVFQNTTLTLSNVVGPIEEVEFYGNPIVYLAPGVFGLPHAIILHYQSYMDKVKIVLSVDELIVADPHQLLDDLAESLELIKGAAVKRSEY